MFEKQPRVRRRNAVSYHSNYEQLEQRAMLAGNVLINAGGGENLYIRGDSAGNQIEIIGNFSVDNDIHIRGLNGTTLNGKSDPIILQARNGGGNFGDPWVATELGLRTNLGKGDDSLLVSGIRFDSESIIYGSAGDDSISLNRVDFPNDLTIQTFTGDDSIGISTSTIYGDTRIFSLDGNDTIGFESTVFWGSILAVTGNDDDTVLADRGSQSETLILTQAGNDFVSLRDPAASGAFRTFLGDGNDTLVGTSPFANLNPVVLSGQKGFDSVDVSVSDDPNEKTSVRAFEQNNVEDGLAKTELVCNDLIQRQILLVSTSDAIAAIPALSVCSQAVDRLSTADVDYGRLLDSTKATFVPTDAAFAALAPGTLDSLSDGDLRELLDYHRASDTNDSELFERDLFETDKVTTLLNESQLDGILGEAFSVEVTSNGVVLNGDTKLVIKNFRTNRPGSVLHVIDAVLIPPS
ncbi:MAG: fasciclin domain-containing protein [Mariniblastus sp.]